MNFKKTTLSNGLRIITVPTKGNPSVTVMVLVETGSNYEKKSENGLSHFLEHMMFKGTTKRPSAAHVSRELDGLGALSNAFTSNELTAYYAKAEKKHFKKILEIVSDLYLDPLLPASELEKERGVILQEISMYEDLPQRKVEDVLMELMYGDTPAGRSIIGPKENIKKFSRKDFINYRKKHYVAGKTAVIVAGDLSEKEVLAEVKKLFAKIPKRTTVSKDKIKKNQKTPQIKIFKKKTDQTHMIFAFHGAPANSEKRIKLEMLATILGQGMSSRLWHKMREEMGACYYIYASCDSFTDHGIFSISTGIEAKRAEEVIREIIAECKRMTEEFVSENELEKAKEFALGHMYMSLETTNALARFYAEQEVTTRKLKNPKKVEQEIRSIITQDIQKVAREIFQNKNLNLAIVGDVKNPSALKKVLKF